MSIGFANAPGPIFKFLLRLHLRRHARSGELDPSQKKAIQDVLADEGGFSEAAQAAFDFAVGCGQGDLLSELEAASGPQKPIGRLLQWLWDNRQQVLQFVLMIVGLFTGGTIPLPKAPAAPTAETANLSARSRAVGLKDARKDARNAFEDTAAASSVLKLRLEEGARDYAAVGSIGGHLICLPIYSESATEIESARKAAVAIRAQLEGALLIQ